MNLLTSLRYLAALDEHRHYARAAQSCHVTQPALSNALRALEREFGTPIVRRGRTYQGLTPEGERILASGRRMLHEHALLQQELQSRAQDPQGVLRLGVVPTAVPLGARFAASLQARYPRIRPVVRSLSSQELEAGLESLSIDLGLGFVDRLPARSGQLRALPQYVEHYYLVRRANSPANSPANGPENGLTGGPAGGLRRGPPVRWAEAAQLPLCLLTPDMHHRQLVDAAFARAGAAVSPAMESNSLMALALAVEAGAVCSVAPGALLGSLRGAAALQACPLVEPELATPVGLIVPAQAAPAPVLDAALAWAGDAGWQALLAASLTFSD